MTTKISKLTETFSGNTSGSLLVLDIDPSSLAMPDANLGNDAVYYVKVTVANTSSDGGGPNGSRSRNADFNLSGGTLTLGTLHAETGNSGNVNINISATVSDTIEVDLTYINTLTQTDGRVWVEIFGYSI